MSNRSSIIRKALVSGALVTGVGLGAAGIASAATGSSTTTDNNSSAPAQGTHGGPGGGRPMNPAAMSHGPGETLLTGADLQKADDAAKAAVPGATVIRAETDSSGASKYEVHMQKSDGSYVTVELDSNFGVVRTISGFGVGPAGRHAPAPSGTAAPGGVAAPPSSAA